MKERPIIMSGDNPKLILEGRKTQTRRIVDMGRIKPSVWKHESIGKITQLRDKNDHDWIARIDGYNVTSDPFCCPYGVAGDRLWVRESFFIDNYEFYPHGRLPKERPASVLDEQILYRADGTCCEQLGECQCEGKGAVWRPSIHMPRWASRITLEITNVRVERLQDISPLDCIQEGISLSEHKCGCEVCAISCELCPATESSLIMAYAELWDSLHGKGAWDKNPWVWVIEFRLI